MTPNLMGLLALVALLSFLLWITWYDICGHRIPNQLVMIGMLLGLCLNGFLPDGLGFNSFVPGGLGFMASVQGLCLGLLLMLPMYWLKAMGAGDVKLMAMVGSFVGPNDVLGILLATFIAGGVMALAVVFWTKQFSRLLQNFKLILMGAMVNMSVGRSPVVDDLPFSVGKLPYAVAISVGTLAYLVWQRMY